MSRDASASSKAENHTDAGSEGGYAAGVVAGRSSIWIMHTADAIAAPRQKSCTVLQRMRDYARGTATPPDLSDLARNLVRVHDAVLSGVAPPAKPREVVARSWRRTMSLGIDPEGRRRQEPLPASAVEALRRRSMLSAAIDELPAPLLAAADASSYLVVVTDAEGIVLWRNGASRSRLQADALGFVEGALWTESAVGTNAIGTALAEAAPVQLFSAEHFENAQVPWYCTA